MVIGAGLRMLHDALPVDSCPWVRDDFGDAPPADRLVVCHGDACAPNTLIDASTAGEARCSGHVDLGALGVADRWADLAVAMLSLGWNYPSSRQRDLLAAYGVDGSSDLAAVRIDYYQRRWQAPDRVGG
jgi:kanamycin kinase